MAKGRGEMWRGGFKGCGLGWGVGVGGKATRDGSRVWNVSGCTYALGVADLGNGGGPWEWRTSILTVVDRS